MRRMIATSVATGLVLLGGVATAESASAETLARQGKTATILPAGAPDGAKVTKSTVTVKKGKKTVAKNKKSYKAKKGTYTVTTTSTFRPRTTAKQAAAADVWGTCRVTTGRTIIDDRTERTTYSDGDVDYFGQVTVQYSGTCTDQLWVDGSLKSLTWDTTWTADELIWTEYLPGSASAEQISAAKAAELGNKIGDVDYVDGEDMAALPTVGWNYGPTTTAKNVRSVVVR